MVLKILVKDIHDFLFHFAPKSLAEDWDHVGLQTGSLRGELKGVFVSLDVTEAVLKEAKGRGANLVVTHHPLFFGKRKPRSPLVLLARRLKIHILSFHTNLDSTREGLNDLLASKLGLKNLRPLVPSKNRKLKAMGLGRVGRIPKTSLKNFSRQVGRALRLKDFRIVGADDSPVRTVAVMTGSGAGYFREAKKAGADVLVTGDAKYHTALDALAEGIALI